MISLEELKGLSIKSETKIVLLVMDGLGGLPHPDTGKTELEAANTPNLDNLAKSGICGLSNPVNHGITPGSGPGHLALFGYPPLKFEIGRGILEALGIDFEVKKNDVAARGNFCTVDEKGNIADRRAGRISTEKCAKLCRILEKIKIKDVQIFVRPVKEHRFLFVMRSAKLAPYVTDTDPQEIGVPPLKANNTNIKGRYSAEIVNSFIKIASDTLKDHHPANMLLLRGFSTFPDLPRIGEIFKLNPAAIASYPMYRGLAKLLGMQVLRPPKDINESIAILTENFNTYDYFFMHVKDTDAAGEDGDFERKVAAIERVDKIIPQITSLKPDVIIVTGDHSTPAVLKSHSWHPVPFLLYSKYCRRDAVKEFSESACLAGGLGIFPASDTMLLAMANALKLTKFGA